MTQASKLSPAMRGMEAIKVYVPTGTANSLRAQAQRLGIPVTAHLAPVLVAVGSGELRTRHEYVPAAVPAVAELPAMADRLRGIPHISESCRALLAHVCREYERTDGDRTVETNRELAEVLHVSAAHVKRMVGHLETAGWLLAKLYASGANGRQLWPSPRAVALYCRS